MHINLQIQLNSYQNTHGGFFHRTRTIIQKFIQNLKTLNSHSNLEKEESWRYYTTWYQILLQGYSNQNSMVLTYEQTERSINTIESPEINPCVCGQLIFDKRGIIMQCSKDSLFNKWSWVNQTGMCKKVKIKTTPSTHTIYQNKLKMDRGLKYKL